MPVVQRNRQQLSIGAGPNARLQSAETALSRGAGVERAKQEKAGAVEQFGGTVARIGARLYEDIQAKEKESADTTAILEARNKLAAAKNRILLDPEAGALNKRGKDAMGIPEEVRTQYEEAVGEIRNGLTTDQQAIFAKDVSSDWMQTDLQVRRHVFDQANQYKQGELEANIKNQISAAQAAYLDPKTAMIEMNKGVEALRTAGPQLGYTPEQLEQMERGIRSSVHTGVINNLLSAEKTEAAKVYFDKTKDQIDGAAIDEIQKALDIGTDKKEAQKHFDKIMQEGGTWSEKRAKARTIEDADQRDLTEHYLDAEEARADRQEREDHKTLLRGAWDVLDKTKGRPSAIPVTVWRDMEPEERRGAQIYAEAVAGGIPIKTNQQVFYRLMQQAANDPGSFIKANIYGERANLSDNDLQQLAGLQVSIANGDRVAAGKLLNDYRTEKQVIDQALTSSRVDPNPDPTKEPEKAAAVANLQRMVADRVRELQENTKKPVTNQDIQAITDDILQQTVDVPGSWWKLYSDATKKKLVDATIDDIPDDELEQVRSFLQSKGIPDTDDNILAYWTDARARSSKRKK